MSDRLIKLLDKAEYERMKYEMAQKFYPFGEYKRRSEFVADYLLENGVIVPPCMVGDTVYIHSTIIWEDECGKCEHFRVGGMGDPHECARTRSPFKHPDCTLIKTKIATQKDILVWLAFDEFGKTVFLTKEEAEQALKERGEQ